MLLFFFFVFYAGSAFSQSYCVKKPATQLRYAPRMKAKVSWRVPKYMPLQGTGKKKKPFVEVVDVDGKTHWVLESDITKQWSCLVVKSKMASLRDGPGLNFNAAKIPQVDKYTAFLDLGGEDGWALVEMETGQQSWVDLDRTWRPRSRIRMSFEAEKGSQ